MWYAGDVLRLFNLVAGWGYEQRQTLNDSMKGNN
jgi:hypothetical protein